MKSKASLLKAPRVTRLALVSDLHVFKFSDTCILEPQLQKNIVNSHVALFRTFRAIGGTNAVYLDNICASDCSFAFLMDLWS